MFCKNCGEKMNDESINCPSCDKKTTTDNVVEGYRKKYKIFATLGTIVLVDVILGAADIHIISWLLYALLINFFSEDTVFTFIGFYKISYLIFFLIAVSLNRTIKKCERNK